MTGTKVCMAVAVLGLLGILEQEAMAKTRCASMVDESWSIPSTLVVKAGKFKSSVGILLSVNFDAGDTFRFSDGARNYDGFWTQKGCVAKLIFSQASQAIIAEDATAAAGGIPFTVTRFLAKIKLKRIAGETQAVIDLRITAYAIKNGRRIRVLTRARGTSSAGLTLVGENSVAEPTLGAMLSELWAHE